jgi:hypothetical protein
MPQINHERFSYSIQSLMNLSIPTNNAGDCMGTAGTAVRIAASVTNPVPVTPEAHLEAIMAKIRIPAFARAPDVCSSPVPKTAPAA